MHRLGGRQVSELSLSSRTGLLDLERRRALRRRARVGGPARRPRSRELVLAGTDAGRSDGAALPGTEGAVLTVAGHDHLVAGVGVGVIAPGDVLDSCGTAEALVRVAPAAGRRRAPAQRAGRRDRRLARGRGAPGPAGRRVVRPCPARGARRSSAADRDELSAGALAIAPGDAPALELELHSLERPPRAAARRRAGRACGARAIDTVTREVAGAHRPHRRGGRPAHEGRRHRRLGARPRRASTPSAASAPSRRRRSSRPAAAAPRCWPAWPPGSSPSADDLPAVSAIEKEPA